MARNRYFEDEALQYKFDRGALKKTLRFIKPHRKLLIGMIAVMLVMSFVALVPPLLNRYIIDYVISKEGFAGLDYVQAAVILITAWGLIGVTDVVYTFFRTYYMSKTGHGIVAELRRDSFVKLQRLAFDYFDNRPAGKILVRLTNYLNELADIFSTAVVNIIVESSKILLILVWLYVLDYRLAAVVTVSVVPMGVIIFFLRRALTKRHRFMRNKNSNRTAYIAENIQGNLITKAFDRCEFNAAVNDDLNAQCNRAWTRVVHLNEFMWPTMDGFYYLGLLAVYGVTLFLALGGAGLGGLTIGKLVSFISYMGMFSAPLNNIANVTQQLTAATTNLERVFEMTETPPSIYDKEGAVTLPEVKGHVTFDSVDFAYEKGINILENFNLDVPAGKMIALVGPTGAGKTTVVNLLSRFYDVTGGAVCIDGYDVRDVSLHSLRTQVGVMMQDSFVFSGTILDNIRYARPEATAEECIAAARAVHADTFIEKLPNGYNTVTREMGAGLSAGERQLLSFARVLLTDPRILILDEATSSIDTETEELIRQALDTVLKGRTSFVIAHRLSTIRKADCILYIANKGIAEAGTHKELMEKHGLYYHLVTGGKENPAA